MAEQILNWWNSDLTVTDTKNMRDYRANAIQSILNNLSMSGSDTGNVTKEKLENLYKILTSYKQLPTRRIDRNETIDEKFRRFLRINLNYRIPNENPEGIFQQDILKNIYSLINRNSNISNQFATNLQTLVSDLSGDDKQLIRDLSKKSSYNIDAMNEMARTGNIIENYLWPIAAIYYATKFHFIKSQDNGIGLINALIEMKKEKKFSLTETHLFKNILKRIKSVQPALSKQVDDVMPLDDVPDSIKNSVPESRSAVLKGILSVL
jgi:hypothetical protein